MVDPGRGPSPFPACRGASSSIVDHEAHVFTFDAEQKVVAYRHILDTYQHRWASQPG